MGRTDATGSADRREAIEAAAYAVLAERGYRRTSMLAVATAAGASNQTLYRWYGGKQGLFAALIARNADEAMAALAGAPAADRDARMVAFGRALLRMLTGDRAVALNRAAAADADETGELGRALAASGRERVLPALVAQLREARPDVAEAGLDALAELYVSLLVGDLQIRRATGALGAVEEATVDRRARRAWAAVKAEPAP